MISIPELSAKISDYGAVKVVLALSGGLDSMVLLDMLYQARKRQTFQLQAVYVNHGLSADAQRWSEHCQQACLVRKVDFFSRQITIDNTTNIEAAAREGRYQALSAFVDSVTTILMTGHHADDQLETLLLALKRGAGAAGLSGMAEYRPFANGSLLRPLLNSSRQQILNYATTHQLQWVEDDSNQDNRFDRNYIRNVVAPLLTGRWPSFTQTTLRSMQHLAQQQQLLDFYTEQALTRCADERQLKLDRLQQQIPLQQDLVIRRWLARFHLNPSSQWLQTLREQVIGARQDAMPQLVLGRYLVRRYLQQLYLEPNSKSVVPESGLRWTMQQNLSLPAAVGELVVYDRPLAGRLAMQRTEVTIVFGQLSLPFKPADQPQHKPLKQWFKLWQLPPWQRGQVPLLLQGKTLVAVAGYATAISTTEADCWLDWERN
ncbi:MULTISPECIES: tRNA lysidine(34) synthetase TilS [unclassified Arsukibacterium]|uniref:tRNA lysidine(34) synthetase TilS n=1 Tax=unclassified Arsukibacterium TaxID=2635278 RepID=UPI000C957920|nr:MULTISPECIES: tRNA lysidine(34) synthetase TilS [unclassified Arsukibacterium]MAA95664.1 tRNA lysidine(34) synthetase TilS [Rheinheimera sp.]HAW92680.1 tRNA lysidine(34) synthetase TilS [Candidatus Azambacteria bacterium]|tara:strand:- start:891 stop:2183 length:1293 start_codon:yes stop_codon:yes gene_type:complete